MKILAVSGSLREGSYNSTLIKAIQSFCIQNTSIEILNLRDIPFFNEDLEVNLPKEIKSLETRCKDCEGFLIACPEYNGMISGVLKTFWTGFQDPT
jgi:chromate reductase, NAD(P)H dehydrogenase (quinone)